MSQPKFTLQQIINAVNARPTTPELELAVLEFLELSDGEQKALLFRELVSTAGRLNAVIEELQRK